MISDVTVVIPCYNEDVKGVVRLHQELTSLGFYVIIVDDGSHMELPDEMNTISYPVNMGYGYALKQGIKAAMTPYILTLDGDGQHRPEDAEKLYKVFKMITNCDMLVGCRWSLEEVWYRWFFRKLINFTASVWAKNFMQDLNSGMRIFRKDLAISYSEILCDTFSFTTSLTMCLVADKHKVAWFPIDVKQRSHGKSRVKLIRDGLITVWFIFYIGAALNTRNIRRTLRNYFSFSRKSGV